MVNTATCNAVNTAGCSQPPATVDVPAGAAWVDVDHSTDTVYVSGFGLSLGPVSIIDGRTCNAAVTSGCDKPQPVVVAGSAPIGIVVDQQTHDVFVSNQEDSTVSVIDGATCNAITSRGCSSPPLSVGVGFDTATPGLDPATQTLYVPSQDLNTISVVDATACTATRRSGCRQAAPTTTVGNGPQGMATDPSTGTLYVTNQDDNTLSLVNTHSCNASHLSGCAGSWPTFAVGTSPKFITIDRTTHTGYIADVGDGIVWAFDVAHCNSNIHSGCQFHAITVSANPDYLDWMAVDDATHTLYVTDRNADGLAMIDMSTCNAGDFSSCGQTPQFASTGSGSGPDGVVLDPASQSLYVADTGTSTVSLLGASTCNAQVVSGCSAAHPTVTVDSRPTRIALDQMTDTIFVASRDTDRVNVIDGRTCNVGTTTGCGAPVANITVSQPNAGEVAHPTTIAVDQSKNLIFLTDVVDSDIVVLNGATCNGQNTSGCNRRIGDLIRTGGWPANLALDPSLGTGYTPDNVDGEITVFSLPG
jgi:DNA-binding beta-propeller fold protein YncE